MFKDLLGKRTIDRARLSGLRRPAPAAIPGGIRTLDARRGSVGGDGPPVGGVDARYALAGLSLSLLLSAVAGCGGTESSEGVESRVGALSTADARILGFETPTVDWTVVNGGLGTITASTIHDQGAFSLAVNARGYVPIRSVALSTLGATIGATVKYDIMLPTQQPNPFWFGNTQLFVNLPSQGVFNQFVGEVELTGLPLNQFVTVQMTLPTNLLTALRATYTDLQVTVVVNVASNATGTYRLDNLQFANTTPPPPPIMQISSDTFTNATSQHATQVEPDSFSFGSTIVSVVQSGRFADTAGGSSDTEFATSKDNGATWVTGSLPGITTFAGGSFDRVSDPTIAFDSRHNVWIAAGLPIIAAGNLGAAISANRSTDGGLTWSNPVLVATASGSQNFDKDWIVCDNSTTSPFFGNCYVEWDDDGNGEVILMSTSGDGGLTWGPPRATADGAAGVGGQPIVLPNGTVVVTIPAITTFETDSGPLLAFRSTDGGNSWSATTTVANMTFHEDGGGVRSEVLPSAEVDGAGRVYVAWPDCSFRTGCTANDIVMSTSTDGLTWSPIARIPIDPITSTVDHFIPGLGVDVATSGATAHLGLTYYFYPNSSCTVATCQLEVGFISSTNGGATWSIPVTLAGPMSLSWIAASDDGPMVGDYVSTSFAGGTAHSFFVVATAPTGSVFNEALFTATNTP